MSSTRWTIALRTSQHAAKWRTGRAIEDVGAITEYLGAAMSFYG